MKKTFLILFAFYSAFTFAQRDSNFIYEDFNKDGFIDTLETYSEGGSGFGGRYVIVNNGKNDEQYVLNNDACFCKIYRTILIPPNLQNLDNEAFLGAMKEQILPKIRKTPESSFEWIINSNLSHNVLDDHKYFDLILDPQNKLIKGQIQPLENYCLEFHGDSLDRLYVPDYEIPNWYNSSIAEAYLVYYAHNHYDYNKSDSLKFVMGISEYKIYQTSHGIFIQKSDVYKCLFVSDFNLTGGPEKLRWKSISDILIKDNYLIVKQSLFPNVAYNIFIINMESGRVGRLKYNVYDSNHGAEEDLSTLFIENYRIVFDDVGNQVDFDLKALFQELDSYVMQESQIRRRDRR